MLRRLLTITLLTFAAAGVSVAQPAPTSITVTLQFTPAEVSYIGNALGRMPYGEVRPIIDKIQQQLNAQAEAAKQAEKPNGEKRE